MANKKNVYLYDLGTGTNRNLLPLSIGLVGSYSMSLPELSKAYHFEFRFLRDSPEIMVSSMENPAVIGVSTYVWNKRASMALVNEIHQRYPDALIVLGGYSVPKHAERIMPFFDENPGVKVLIHGEGELTFAALLRQLLINHDLSEVEGLTVRCPDKSEGFLTTQGRARIKDLNILPSPFLNGVFDTLMARHGKFVTGVVWETSRGCPYQCTFCDWGNADVNKVRRFNMNRLHEELKWMSRNKIFYIYGADANFGIFFERDLEITGYIADLCQETTFPKYLMINWLKNSHTRIVSLAERLTKGGVMTNVTLALQSTNQITLDAIKRRNIKQDSFLALKKEFHDRRLPTYIELILGLPMESYQMFVNGLEEITTSRLDDHFVIYICTLLENTEMASSEYRQSYQLVSRQCAINMSRREVDDSNGELEELVVATSSMPIGEWKRAYVFAYYFTVLYNHRAAFFVMTYLKKEFDVSRIDFVTFLIDTVRSESESFPSLALGLSHLDKQRNMILSNISSTCCPDGLDGVEMSPHEGMLPLLTRDLVALSTDLKHIVLQFAKIKSLPLDEAILDDVLLYQNARTPTWPLPVHTEYRFSSTIPEYFDKLVWGLEPLPICKAPCIMKVMLPKRGPTTYKEFAMTVVRAGHTVDLYTVTIEKPILKSNTQQLWTGSP